MRDEEGRSDKISLTAGQRQHVCVTMGNQGQVERDTATMSRLHKRARILVDVCHSF